MPREADPIARARARKQSQTLMLAISAGAVVVVIIGVALGVYLTSGGGLSGPAKGGLRAVVGGEDASKWNHAELLEHINSRMGGEKYKQLPAGGFVPTAYFVRADANTEDFGFYNDDRALVMQLIPLIEVEKHPTAQKAKDLAGTDPNLKWSYGPWLFRCSSHHPKELDPIKKALN